MALTVIVCVLLIGPTKTGVAAVADTLEDQLSVPADYIPGVCGHGVLVVGPDQDGADALAVWKLGPTGYAGGAWILRFDAMQQDVNRLRQIVSQLHGRCLVDWDRERPASALDRIADLLPIDLLATLREQVLILPDLLTEIAEHRSAYADAVERYHSSSKSKITPLSWPTPVPGPDEQASWAATITPTSADSPIVTDALTVAATLTRVVGLWQDTEQARYRRAYLRSFGEPQPLPPAWLAKLRAAARDRTAEPIRG